MVAKAESELTARFLDYSTRVFVWNIVGKPERIGNYTAQTKCLDKGIRAASRSLSCRSQKMETSLPAIRLSRLFFR